MEDRRPEISYWREFGSLLKDRFAKPWSHPTFVMYFVGIIMLLGGFGIAEPAVNCWVLGKLPADELPKALVSAAFTYFVAIAATAAVDLILAYKQRKYMLMFFVLALLIVLLCGVLSAGFGTVLGKPEKAIIPVIVGYALALFLWWVGNANNAQLLDAPVEPTSPTGGDAGAKPKGDLSGYTL
jgi:hypothetical protein